jgi:hypothetical protein
MCINRRDDATVAVRAMQTIRDRIIDESTTFDCGRDFAWVWLLSNWKIK